MESNAALETGTYQVRCVQSADGTGEPGYQIADGQVTDPATGLTWQQGFSAAEMTAAAAPSYCAGLDLDGHSWRLPSIKELATLVDEDRVSPAIDVSAFPRRRARRMVLVLDRLRPLPAGTVGTQLQRRLQLLPQHQRHWLRPVRPLILRHLAPAGRDSPPPAPAAGQVRHRDSTRGNSARCAGIVTFRGLRDLAD